VTRKSFDELIIRVLQDDCTPEERAEFDQLSVSDQNFVRKVEAVKSWLDPLSEEESSQAPDETLLDDIFKEIDAPDAPDH
jgi:anti-sigma-K factor RskA